MEGEIGFMRIAHVLWGLPIGGTECMLVDIVNEQIKTEQVSIVVVDDNVNTNLLKKIDPKVRVFFCKRKRGRKSVAAVIKLNYYLFKLRPDITHLHMGYGLGKIVLWPGKKVRTVHNTTNSPAEYYKFDKLFAISKAVQKEITSQGYESVLVSNGIKTNSVKFSPTILKREPVNIVQIGRLHTKQKGQDLLIKAVDILNKTYDLKKFTPFKIHFVGTGEDLPFLQDMIERCELQDFFCFEGLKNRDWIYEHLRDFDLFVQPSYFEGFGLTVAEAMAAKIPVLVSDVEGPLEILSSTSLNSLLGWTFKVGDAQDLSCKIKQFLEGKYDTSLLDKAREHVEKCYDISSTVSKYLVEYRKMLSKN